MGAEQEQDRRPAQSTTPIRAAQTGPGTPEAAAQVLNSPASKKALDQWHTNNGRFTSAPTQQPKVIQAISTFIGVGSDAKIELFESARSGALKGGYISGAIVQAGGTERIPFLIQYPIKTDSTPAYILQGEKLWKNAGGDTRRDEILQGERRDAPTDLSSPKNRAILADWNKTDAKGQPLFNAANQDALGRELAHQLALPGGYTVALKYTPGTGAEERIGNSSVVRGNIYKTGVKEPVAEFALQYGRQEQTRFDIKNKDTNSAYTGANNPLSHDGGRAHQVQAVQRVLNGQSE